MEETPLDTKETGRGSWIIQPFSSTELKGTVPAVFFAQLVHAAISMQRGKHHRRLKIRFAFRLDRINPMQAISEQLSVSRRHRGRRATVRSLRLSIYLLYVISLRLDGGRPSCLLLQMHRSNLTYGISTKGILCVLATS